MHHNILMSNQYGNSLCEYFLVSFALTNAVEPEAFFFIFNILIVEFMINKFLLVSNLEYYSFLANNGYKDE